METQVAQQTLEIISTIFGAYWEVFVGLIILIFLKDIVSDIFLWVNMRLSKSSASNPRSIIIYQGKRYRFKRVTWNHVYLVKHNLNDDGSINVERPDEIVQIPISKYWNSPITYIE